MVIPTKNKDKRLFMEDFRLFLNGMEFKEIAPRYNITWQNLGFRIRKTHDFLEKTLEQNKIEYPTKRYGGHKLLTARENKNFWLRVIDDYEKGSFPFEIQIPKAVDYRINTKNNERAFRNWSLKTKGFVNMQEKECWDNAVQWAVNRLGKKINILKEELVENEIDGCES